MKKAGGYLLMAIGLALIIANSMLSKLDVFNSLPPRTFLIAGGVAVVLGFFLTLGKKVGKPAESGKGGEEVPIYEGEKIIGYRRKK